jgi:iron complex transport system substrate-binding protein
MKKKLLLFVIIFTMISMVACTKSSMEEPQGTQGQKGEKQVTIKDHLDRTVTIEKLPERIVSGYYISTSALIALGLQEKIVGIEAKANTRPIYALAAPELLELPNVGTAKEFDLEACLSLDPDLVILPIKLKDQINTLEEMGVHVIGVNPENEGLLIEMIEMIGKLTGVENYEELLTYYTEKGNKIKKIYLDSNDEPKVYLAGNSSMLSTATGKMYQNDLIEAAGGINVANGITDFYWANISYEQLIAYNPDYIIIVPEANYTKEDVMMEDNISKISAIQNNHIYQMPSDLEAWDSPVPSSILGKMWLTSMLNRDEYSYESFVDEVYDFYYRFYGFEIDKEALLVNE